MMLDASWWDTISSLSGTVEEQILGFSESPWLYPSVYGVAVVDGIFPVVPSESVVIASAAAWRQVGSPILALLWLVAAMGAWTGDQLAYYIGSKIKVAKFRLFRTGKGRATLDWAEHALEKRGTSFIIAARFIPMGRVAVNLSAGTLGYPRKRFMGVAAIAAAIWASYGIALGVVAGSALEGNLLASIGIGVAGGIVLGYIVDRVMAAFGLEKPNLPNLDQLPEEPATT